MTETQREASSDESKLGAEDADIVHLRHVVFQKELLLKEMNHRIQNSLQLVSSFLNLQARACDRPEFAAAVEEACRRLNAVSLVHRRLYQTEQVDCIGLSCYLQELWDDLASSLGEDWSSLVTLDLIPVNLAIDRAISVGLILTELVINAAKYAYEGAPGPLEIRLDAADGWARLTVADTGTGLKKITKALGFGSRMVRALVTQLGGELSYLDNHPGARAILSFPLADPHPNDL